MFEFAVQQIPCREHLTQKSIFSIIMRVLRLHEMQMYYAAYTVRKDVTETTII